MSRRLTHLSLFITCLIGITDTSSATPSLETVLERIKIASRQVNTIESEFLQIRQISLFSEPDVSAGKFYYRKEDCLRWEVITPEPMGFLVNGKQGKRWKNTVKHSQLFDIESMPFVSLFSDQVFSWTNAYMDAITKQYRIDIVSEPPIILKLSPRLETEERFLDYVLLYFSSDADYIENIVMYHADGDQTDIRFVNTIINKTLPDNLFE